MNLKYPIDSFSFKEKENSFKQFKICLKKSSDYYVQWFWKLHEMICSFIQHTLKKVNIHKKWVLCISIFTTKNIIMKDYGRLLRLLRAVASRNNLTWKTQINSNIQLHILIGNVKCHFFRVWIFSEIKYFRRQTILCSWLNNYKK